MVDIRGKVDSEWLRVPIYAVLLFQLSALISRSLIDVQMRNNGYHPDLATNLSYLAVPALLWIFMLPIWKHHGKLIKALLQVQDLNWRTLFVGMMLAITLWLAVVLTNVAVSAHEFAVQGPLSVASNLKLSWSCANYLHLILGVVISVMMIPIIEEVVNRGFVLHYFLPRGRWIAILLSAALFAILHKPNSLPIVFIAGIYFALLTLHHVSLWPATIAHATYNLFVQLDESCMLISWTKLPTTFDVSWISLIVVPSVFILLVIAAVLVSPKLAGAH